MLVKALIGSVVAGLLSIRSAFLLQQHSNMATILQLFGSICLMIVALTHIAEALQLLPFMGWGQAHSAGHYVDLTSAVMAVTLLPVGYLMRRREAAR